MLPSVVFQSPTRLRFQFWLSMLWISEKHVLRGFLAEVQD
jgi:hypothetical protein